MIDANASNSESVIFRKVSFVTLVGRKVRPEFAYLSERRSSSPMLRLYWPKETPPSIIDGTWKPPAVTQVP
jgi:hypothetical protein